MVTDCARRRRVERRAPIHAQLLQPITNDIRVARRKREGHSGDDLITIHGGRCVVSHRKVIATLRRDIVSEDEVEGMKVYCPLEMNGADPETDVTSLAESEPAELRQILNPAVTIRRRSVGPVARSAVILLTLSLRVLVDDSLAHNSERMCTLELHTSHAFYDEFPILLDVEGLPPGQRDVMGLHSLSDAARVLGYKRRRDQVGVQG